MIKKLKKVQEEKEISAAAPIGLPKAFGCISHELLLNKLDENEFDRK